MKPRSAGHLHVMHRCRIVSADFCGAPVRCPPVIVTNSPLSNCRVLAIHMHSAVSLYCVALRSFAFASAATFGDRYCWSNHVFLRSIAPHNTTLVRTCAKSRSGRSLQALAVTMSVAKLFGNSRKRHHLSFCVAHQVSVQRASATINMHSCLANTLFQISNLVAQFFELLGLSRYQFRVCHGIPLSFPCLIGARLTRRCSGRLRRR